MIRNMSKLYWAIILNELESPASLALLILAQHMQNRSEPLIIAKWGSPSAFPLASLTIHDIATRMGRSVFRNPTTGVLDLSAQSRDPL
jgi:hypothetical protein